MRDADRVTPRQGFATDQAGERSGAEIRCLVARCAIAISDFACCLARLVANHLGLQLITPPMRVPGFDVTMAWHTRFHRDPSVTWLRGVFVELFEQR